MRYGEWIAPLPSHHPRHLPGHNSSYKRKILLEYGAKLESMLESETPMQWDMASKGYKLYIEPKAKSYHLNYSLFHKSIGIRFHGGRLFAARRARKWLLLHRVLYIGGSPLIPLVRLRRVLATAYRINRPELIPQIFAFLIILLIVDAMGEMVGYAIGAGDASRKISNNEFHRERFLNRRDRKFIEHTTF
jgi:hypothetical protein